MKYLIGAIGILALAFVGVMQASASPGCSDYRFTVLAGDADHRDEWPLLGLSNQDVGASVVLEVCGDPELDLTNTVTGHTFVYPEHVITAGDELRWEDLRPGIDKHADEDYNDAILRVELLPEPTPVATIPPAVTPEPPVVTPTPEVTPEPTPVVPPLHTDPPPTVTPEPTPEITPTPMVPPVPAPAGNCGCVS